MGFKIKAMKDYRVAGWFRYDFEKHDAFLMKHSYQATVIPDCELAYLALDMLQHGTVEANDGMSFEVVSA